ncbi:hypothetical protein I3J27_38660 [Bradyrhizobium xenonodulans]|uniref:Uncharacterized protein n=1 Tax=Bradyrhizobium xenonodulans TaxID=2736875 RepID=A0ABY7MK58_9BRAD|nr:hypothetical protein [Bradyrhizobium xenonodulans]WBL78788.1 hypothetical protein I3J27_38660 [Bradyrhizobium xenonodulans]
MPLSIDDVAGYEREAMRYYFLWYTIYILLGGGAITFPALAAMGVTFGIAEGAKYLSGAGGLCAALFGFLKPNDYLAVFDAAITEFRSLRVRFSLLTDEQRAEKVDYALRLTVFKYPGVSASIPQNPSIQRDKVIGPSSS